MKIIANYSKDTQTEKPTPSSYEWWYFDAQSVDGYKIVVIFYEGNPFSKRYIRSIEKGENRSAAHYPAISISVYQNEKPIYYSFREVEPEFAEFSNEIPFGKIEECLFEGQNHQARIEYSLDLKQQLPNGDSINAQLLFSSDIQSVPNFPTDPNVSDAHVWNLVLPSCYVQGEIKIDGYQKKKIEFKGLGYHDHNTGFEPLKDSFEEWYWGRYHLKDLTLVYYLMNRGNSWEYKAWLIHKNGTVRNCRNFAISNYGLSFFGLKTGRVIEGSVDDSEIFVQLDQILDNGPFYQRFGGRMLLKSEGKVKEAKGISEYIKPSRIHQKLFRPLVNMRIIYPGKIHWVQRSPHLYRWTW